MILLIGTFISSSAVIREQCISDDNISLSFQIDSVLYLKSPKSNPDAYNIKIDGFTELIGDGIPAVLKRVERFELHAYQECFIIPIYIKFHQRV